MKALCTWLQRPTLLALLIFLTAPAASEEARPQVQFETDVGPITLELLPEAAPETVKNFLRYVDDGFYNGTIFHRVIPGFVVQGGGMTYDFTAKDTRDPVANESANGLSNKPMTVSMARKSDPDSATSQFFINLNHNQSLDAQDDQPGYTVFGRVIEGHEAVIAIVEEPRGDFKHHPDAPNTPVRILKSTRLNSQDRESAPTDEGESP